MYQIYLNVIILFCALYVLSNLALPQTVQDFPRCRSKFRVQTTPQSRAIHLEYHSQASPPARLPRTRQLDPLLSATEKTHKQSPADALAAATEKYSRPRSSTPARRILFPGYRRPRSSRSSVPWSLRFTQHQHTSPNVSRDRCPSSQA